MKDDSCLTSTILGQDSTNSTSSLGRPQTTTICQEQCPIQKIGLEGQLNLKEGFQTSIECQIKCQNDTHSQKLTTDHAFVPEEQNLRHGDGGLWASLTSTLDYWSQEQCIILAKNHCHDLNKIAEVERLSVRSGQWSFDSSPTCSGNQKIMLSPFEKSLRAL